MFPLRFVQAFLVYGQRYPLKICRATRYLVTLNPNILFFIYQERFVQAFPRWYLYLVEVWNFKWDSLKPFNKKFLTFLSLKFLFLSSHTWSRVNVHVCTNAEKMKNKWGLIPIWQIIVKNSSARINQLL